MRVLNILAAGLVLVGAVIVSYSHTAALFAAAGYRGLLVHVGVCVVELTFLMGALNIVTARVRGVKVGAPPVLGALLGVLVVGYSNVRAGLAYGWEGVALGAVIPAALVVTEGILAWAILQGRKVGESPTETEPGEIIAHPAQRIAQQVEPSPIDPGEITQQEKEPPTDPGEPAQQIAQVGDAPPSPAQVATNEKQEQAKTPIPDPEKVARELAPPATIITDTGENAPAIVEPAQQVGERSGDNAQEVAGSLVEVGEIREESPSREDKPSENAQAAGDGLGDMGETTQQAGDIPSRRGRLTQEEIKAMAMEAAREEKEPSKREIMRDFGITDYYARKVKQALDEMKQAV